MNFAIILAGGQGKRFGASIPKQYIEVNGKPLLYYTIKAFEESDVDKISIVAGSDYVRFVLSEIVDKYNFKKVFRICEGGSERFISALHGLDDISDVASDNDIVLIHDGARPFIKPCEINTIIDETHKYGAAIAAMPVKDTIKIAREVCKDSNANKIEKTNKSENGENADKEYFVESTTARSLTWQIQTPQGFDYKKLFDAYKQLGTLTSQEKSLITDDSMIWEKAYKESYPVKLVKTSYSNIKITNLEDLEVAKASLK